MSKTHPTLSQKKSSRETFPEWPWLTILIQPRSTIRAIVDSDPERYIIPLAVLAGIGNGLLSDDSFVVNYGLPLGLIIIIIVGGLAGLLGLYIGGAILTWTGGWFDGKASSVDVRAAMAWSAVPVILSLFFVPFMLLSYGYDLFTMEMTRVERNPGPFLFVTLMNVALGAWWYLLFWKCYAEVQQLSLAKALIAIIAPGAIVMAILFGLGMFLMIGP